MPVHSGMISVRSDASFSQTLKFLSKLPKVDYLALLNHYGELGTQALENTPIESGLTASSWIY